MADGVEDAVGGAAAVVGDLDEVVVGDSCLVVGQVLEAGEGVVQLFLAQQQAELFQPLPQRVAARVLAEHDRLPSAPMAAADMTS